MVCELAAGSPGAGVRDLLDPDAGVIRGKPRRRISPATYSLVFRWPVSRGIWAMTGTSGTRLSQPARGVTGGGSGAGTNAGLTGRSASWKPGSCRREDVSEGLERRVLLHDREEAL